MADPAPAHLYLRRVEGGLSWVYCDRDTSFALVDALALLRPRPVRAGGHASNAAQRARQHATFEKDMRDWRRWRRTTLAWHEPYYRTAAPLGHTPYMAGGQRVRGAAPGDFFYDFKAILIQNLHITRPTAPRWKALTETCQKTTRKGMSAVQAEGQGVGHA
jgi:hypothetical protein